MVDLLYRAIPIDHRGRVMNPTMVDFARKFGFSPTVFDLAAIVEALDDGTPYEQEFGASFKEELAQYAKFHLTVRSFTGPNRRTGHPILIHALPKVDLGRSSEWEHMHLMTSWITKRARQILGTEFEYWVPGNFDGNQGGRQVDGAELVRIRRAETMRAKKEKVA